MLSAPSRHARGRRAAHAAPGDPLSPGAAILPYDYAASFALTGRPGNVLQDVVNISPDGVFVATAIGYGFEEDRARGVRVQAAPSIGSEVPTTPLVLPGDLTLGDVPVDALLSGFRVNPALHALFFRGNQPDGAAFSTADITGLSDQPVARSALEDTSPRTGLFQRVKTPEEISFLFSIVDSGTGRELQDEPTHNLASLGKSDGERPFRQLATPLLFQPRSSIRVQVIERSDDVRGTLFIVLYGYKILAGSTVCPEPVMRLLTGTPACPIETIGRPDERVVPFDYVATLPLDGRPQQLHEREIGLSTEGGFVVTSIGYGLLVEEHGVPIAWNRLDEVQDTTLRESLAAMRSNGTVDLARVPLRLLPPSTLIDGIRLRPDLVRLALAANGRLANALSLPLADQVFTRLNEAAHVSFRYSFFEGGRGRELQNQPLQNIAGLGAADGDRPFKRLARALVFLPRSTIRVTVQEHFGRGTLFFTFQGYKLLGSAAGGAR